MVYLFRKRKVSHAWGNPQDSNFIPITTGFKDIRNVSTIAKYFTGMEVPSMGELEDALSKCSAALPDEGSRKNSESFVENAGTKPSFSSESNNIQFPVTAAGEIQLNTTETINIQSLPSSSLEGGGRAQKFFEILRDNYPDSYGRTLTIFIDTLQVLHKTL